MGKIWEWTLKESIYLTCHTKFTSIIDLYDGKDLYTDILNGEDWKVARNLHEIIAAFPSFINRMQ